MAVYTHVSREELEAFLNNYDLPELIAHHGIEAGVENSNYRLETEGGNYILTLFEKRVSSADLPFFMDLKAHLAQNGVNVPAPVADQRGRTLGTLCDRPAAIVTFLSGVSEKIASVAHARGAGALLAQLHNAAEGFKQTRLNDLGPEAWKMMTGAMGADFDKISPGLSDELNHEAQYLAEHWPKGLPCGPVHADFFPDNVMFDGNIPVGVFDFYFACTDFFAYDLAIAMNAFTPEDTHSPAQGNAMLESYQSIRLLSGDEMAALPLFWRGAALRFALTRAHDWLHQVPDSLVQVKDPMPWVDLLRAHRQDPPFFWRK